jgi:hypothetical protein
MPRIDITEAMGAPKEVLEINKIDPDGLIYVDTILVNIHRTTRSKKLPIVPQYKLSDLISDAVNSVLPEGFHAGHIRFSPGTPSNPKVVKLLEKLSILTEEWNKEFEAESAEFEAKKAARAAKRKARG